MNHVHFKTLMIGTLLTNLPNSCFGLNNLNYYCLNSWLLLFVLFLCIVAYIFIHALLSTTRYRINPFETQNCIHMYLCAKYGDLLIKVQMTLNNAFAKVNSNYEFLQCRSEVTYRELE